MGKVIKLTHHQDDYECMWNGIEDLYVTQRGEKLPPSFFFSLASFGSFVYLKTDKAEIKRMVALGDGRTKSMYQFLAPIVGFTYQQHQCQSFTVAIKKAKKEIDNGYPVILGTIDMFYLSYYEKFHYQEHIPLHYVLMVGYDDENEQITVHDCGCKTSKQISYDDLSKAWNCHYDGLSKPFTMWAIRMGQCHNKAQIAQLALQQKAESFLHPQVSFTGYKGFDKFIADLPKWKSELGKEEYDKVLCHMVQFYGEVPTIPNALLGIDKPDEIQFCGGFDKISRILFMLGQENNNACWLKVADYFNQGSLVITKIKTIIVDYLVAKNDLTFTLPQLYNQVKEIMINGFNMLLHQ